MTLTDAERARYREIAHDTWTDAGEYDLDAVVAAVVSARDADRTAALRAEVVAWREAIIAGDPNCDQCDSFDEGSLCAYDRILRLMDGGDDPAQTGDYHHARGILANPDGEPPETVIRRMRDGGDDGD